MADLADAQVHATLALAAVLAVSADLAGPDLMAWRDVAAIHPLRVQSPDRATMRRCFSAEQWAI